MQRIRIGVSYLLLIAASLVLARAANASEQADAFRNAKWRPSRITIALSSSLSQNSPNIRGDIGVAVRKSISAWAAAADIEISVNTSELESISPKGPRGDGVSLITGASTAENLRLFPKQVDSPAATTRVFVDRRGAITEADIVLNPFVQFSDDGTFGTYDLQDTLTHEIGHLLGLDHSPVRGSIMYELGSRNVGTGLLGGARGNIAGTDAAAVKGLYGPRLGDLDCCGTVIGRVSGVESYRNHKTLVWLEEVDSGRVAASTVPNEDGSFRIEGVTEGKYRLFAASEVGRNLAGSDEAEVVVATADEIRMNLSVKFKETQLLAPFLGTSLTPAQLPVRIDMVRPNRIYLGGYGIETGRPSVRFSTSSIVVSFQAVEPVEYEDSVKMIGLNMVVVSPLARGEYTLITEDSNGVSRFLVGAIIAGGN